MSGSRVRPEVEVEWLTDYCLEPRFGFEVWLEPGEVQGGYAPLEEDSLQDSALVRLVYQPPRE